ncbi:MAG: DUF951 domain-containing protein [Clostridia bacterium]|jgi:hypothetical protein|nr:DUF951 domain-containing protein [Clostridia bacterium]
MEYALNDVVQMKKPHPCGANEWKIIRVGMDVKIKCIGCAHIVMMPHETFVKRLKKILESEDGRKTARD